MKKPKHVDIKNKILEGFRAHPGVTIKKLGEIIGIHFIGISSHVNYLKRHGYLDESTPEKDSRYRPVKTYVLGSNQTPLELIEEPETQTKESMKFITDEDLNWMNRYREMTRIRELKKAVFRQRMVDRTDFR